MYNVKVNNKIKNNRWYKIPCKCGTEVMDKYPIVECLHCKFEECEKSIPSQDFTVNTPIFDKDGKDTGKTKSIVVTEIFLDHGKKYDDVLGWFW